MCFLLLIGNNGLYRQKYSIHPPFPAEGLKGLASDWLQFQFLPIIIAVKDMHV